MNYYSGCTSASTVQVGNDYNNNRFNTFGQVMQKIEEADEITYRHNPYLSTRCEYCGTKHDNIEKHCSSCGAPL
jgi:transposase